MFKLLNLRKIRKAIDTDGPPLIMELYADGRGVSQSPGPSSTFREYALFGLFKKSLENGDFNHLEAGRYEVHMIKDGHEYAVEARPMTKA